MNTTTTHVRVPSAGQRDGFHVTLALAMTGTAYLGFWFTYFSPIFGRSYPDVSPIVHVHGWSFFIWYILLPVQAGLVRIRRVSTHRRLGMASLGLGAIMVVVGLIVSAVQVALAQRPDGSPFWQLMALPILAIWLLFTVFYVAAMVRRRNRVVHRQLIVLASAVALSAATFRVVLQIGGFTPATAVIGCLVPVVFVLAAMVYEHRRNGSISVLYAVGGAAMLVIISGAFALTLSPGYGVVERSAAWIGEVVSPLYPL